MIVQTAWVRLEAQLSSLCLLKQWRRQRRGLTRSLFQPLFLPLLKLLQFLCILLCPSLRFSNCLKGLFPSQTFPSSHNSLEKLAQLHSRLVTVRSDLHPRLSNCDDGFSFNAANFSRKVSRCDCGLSCSTLHHLRRYTTLQTPPSKSSSYALSTTRSSSFPPSASLSFAVLG